MRFRLYPDTLSGRTLLKYHKLKAVRVTGTLDSISASSSDIVLELSDGSAVKARPLVSVVSLGEVRVLAKRNGWGDTKLAALENALDHLVIVDINHRSVFDAYVEIDTFSQSHPGGARKMCKNDLWIAACAKAAGAELLNTDKDLEHRIPEHVAGVVIDPNDAVERTLVR